MKILIGVYDYKGDGSGGGTETWAQTLADEYRRCGHDVQIVGSRAKNIGGDYDVALVGYSPMLEKIKGLECPKISTCHGVASGLDKQGHRADFYAAVSEEVRDKLHAEGISSEVIRNPIDTTKFKFCESNTMPESVMFYSCYQGHWKSGTPIGNTCASPPYKAREVVAGAFPKYSNVGKWNRIAAADAPVVLGASDLVIGLGRSALEAMSCGCNVIIYDYAGGDGFATPERMVEFRKSNCSGRRYRIGYTPENLRKLADEYSLENGRALRDYVIKNNSVEMIAQQYLELCTQL